MEKIYTNENELKAGLFSHVKAEAVLNMAGVILFYVVVFVAFSVFAGQV